ncbi:MAG: aspartate aminotransferase family protein [Solirubrobacterales bacterium]|nr:aspartate aminotransferase family protein [Solirubrobacterales bacterium]MBV9536949.1 aspartate aminotransferase family protein [Solirubrobacterales bacterium]
MQVAQGSTLLHFSRNGAYQPGAAELLVLERGEGPYVFDTAGRRYVDALSSLFCAQIGYSYGTEMARAAREQLERLAFNNLWGTAHPRALELGENLADLAPEGFGKVFFTSGGSESVEAAWKIARQYHLANGDQRRRKAIARDIAYHGVTLGALSLTGVERFKEPFGPPAIETRHVSNTNAFRSELSGVGLTRALLEELEQAVLEEGPETIAMIIAEPVQNAGGCLEPPPGYWAGLREVADRYGILLVADEVITGCGRLGQWFGVTRFGATPDLITIAKGLTSAYAPMGAVLVANRVAQPLYEDKRTLLHGITFAGHPLSAAIALKNIEIFARDGVLENVRAQESGLAERLESLRELPIVGDVRGAGFFWAVELVKDEKGGRFDADERERLLREFMPARLLEARLIARVDDRGDAVLQIAPPLISTDAVLDEIVDAMRAVLEDAGRFMGVESAVAASR